MKVHELKCHAENFDAVISGAKRFEVRHEDDRRFSVGDRLKLIRTDTDGRPTSEPPAFCYVDVLWLSRKAGALSLFGIDVQAGREDPLALVVMSIGASAVPTPAAVRGRK